MQKSCRTRLVRQLFYGIPLEAEKSDLAGTGQSGFQDCFELVQTEDHQQKIADCGDGADDFRTIHGGSSFWLAYANLVILKRLALANY